MIYRFICSSSVGIGLSDHQIAWLTDHISNGQNLGKHSRAYFMGYPATAYRMEVGKHFATFNVWVSKKNSSLFGAAVKIWSSLDVRFHTIYDFLFTFCAKVHSVYARNIARSLSFCIRLGNFIIPLLTSTANIETTIWYVKYISSQKKYL